LDRLIETAYPAQFELVEVAALATAGTANATPTVARTASGLSIHIEHIMW